MKNKTIKLYTTDIEAIEQLFCDDFENSDVIRFDQGLQILNERYSILNQNCFVDIVLIIKHENYLNVSISTGGASSSFFVRFNWGTETWSIDKKINSIKDWCTINNVKYVDC
jgi:hypothetical protein